MKKVAFFSLLIPALIIALILYIGKANYFDSGVDLNLFDTSIQLTYWMLVIPFLLISFFLFSLLSAIATKFKVSAFNGLLFISSLGILLISIQLLIILL
ncbi:hypothetical protein [Pedobacter sp. Hv1]|uniref:hypothetical protein n=1 Tax=Pedobacter sp. Hv1 TaxID=1740090 RepID=UPI0006D88B28|nr:hypothetical protein [Pedobacter sp. Hv1]KQC02287.1 hypothetical protein AQF98_01545 [Pedobacter sp. Hv1]